ALQYVIVDEPKAARQKGSFTCGQAIGIFGFITQYEFTVDQQSVLDRPKRSLDPRIGCGKKPHERDQQQTCVEPLEPAGLHKAVKVGVETALTDFRVDFVGDLTPPPP